VLDWFLGNERIRYLPKSAMRSRSWRSIAANSLEDMVVSNGSNLTDACRPKYWTLDLHRHRVALSSPSPGLEQLDQRKTKFCPCHIAVNTYVFPPSTINVFFVGDRNN
jgi:hypothetical protein